MRYVIETNNKGIAGSIGRWQQEGQLTVIDSEDPLESMRRKVLHIKELVANLKEIGIHPDVMLAYLRVKTGYGISSINKILNAQQEFFEKLGREKP